MAPQEMGRDDPETTGSGNREGQRIWSGEKLGTIIDTEIRAAGAEGKIAPIDVLRAFNTGFDTSFSGGTGMSLESTVDDALERTIPLQTRATNIDAYNRATQNVVDSIRKVIQERMRQ